MKLGLNIGYFGTAIADDFTLISTAEDLGFDSVWTAEAYGSDALTPLAWIAARTERIRVGSAVFQMPARTPGMTAMTASTLDIMSNGRFLLGLGVSGPQVVEGWHGRPYGKPLGVTREYVAIVRKMLKRDEPVTFDGATYQLPYFGEGATGLGKPLKLMHRPKNPSLPIYIAAIGPKNVTLTAEIADGWLPVFLSPERMSDIYGSQLAEGFELSGEDNKADRFDIAPTLSAVVTDDLDRGRLSVKPFLALYIGGMGAKGRNFYNDLACRYGYVAGPDALVDELALIGSKERIADRLDAWRDSGVTTMILSTTDLETMRTMAELVL
jgi:F420-dependent oxidoreductase-like protein